MKSFFRRTESQDGAGGGPPQTARTVLVVDDSPTETRILVNALVMAGFRVETATNGEQGVEMARRLRPDLILMDVIMPVLNGFGCGSFGTTLSDHKTAT